MPARKRHDLPAAYRDGTARYLNYSRSAVIWDDHADASVRPRSPAGVTAEQVITDAIGVLEQPSVSRLPAADARLMMLTLGGHRFGQPPRPPWPGAAGLTVPHRHDHALAAITSRA
jgi:hypothetical protein